MSKDQSDLSKSIGKISSKDIIIKQNAHQGERNENEISVIKMNVEENESVIVKDEKDPYQLEHT